MKFTILFLCKPIAYFTSKTLPLLLLLKENELKEIWTSLTPKIQRSAPTEVALDIPLAKNLHIYSYFDGHLTNSCVAFM